VDVTAFRRAALELELIDAQDLERCAAAAPGDVVGLARNLMRAGKLTAYQAGALAQGKGRGLIIDGYLILEKRGQGGMGVVFRARHRTTGQVVALKILPPSFGRNRQAVLRFRREFEVATRLSHPNVVAALHADEDRGVQFLTMEYIEGHDLDDLVRGAGPLPIKLALHCTIQAAQGLEAAHAQGIVHRDVKPGNLILDKSGMVRVLDLGLARLIEASKPLSWPEIAATTELQGSSLTQSGVFMGTIDFMAPEQADDAKLADHRADIYSLGCTLYFFLTGHPPFRGGSVLQRLLAHREAPAPSLHAARDDVPAALEQAYQSMMAKWPDRRPRSMTEVVALLEGCRTSADEPRRAHASLKTFAETVMKRAAPRRRDQEGDPSVFATPGAPEIPHFDPDLDLEDLVMDFRSEPHLEPLPEEKLPMKAPPIVRAHEEAPPTRRGPAVLAFAAITLVALCVAGSLPLRRLQPGPGEGGARPKVEATNGEVAGKPGFPQEVGGPGPASKIPGPAFEEPARGAGATPNGPAPTLVATVAERNAQTPSVPKKILEKAKRKPKPKPQDDTETVIVSKSPRIPFSDDFTDPRSGWPQATPEPASQPILEHHGYASGFYRLDAYAGAGAHWAWECPVGALPEFVADVEGRIRGDEPTSQGSWGVVVVGPDSALTTIHVRIDAKARLFIERPSQGVATVGPISHPAIKGGLDAFNTLTLRVQTHAIEVLVNSVRVCDPVSVEGSLTPARLQLAVFCDVPAVHAEFDKIRIQELRRPPRKQGAPILIKKPKVYNPVYPPRRPVNQVTPSDDALPLIP
jgi:serine/threonine protein kinase